jgi:hypothetical protein
MNVMLRAIASAVATASLGRPVFVLPVVPVVVR